MPSEEAIDAAQQRGREADLLMEQSLTGTAPQQQAPSLPTNQQANLFDDAFGLGDTAAHQPDPGVNSRTGQRVSTAARDNNHRQVFVTDAHATVQDGRAGSGRGTSRGRGGHRRGRRTNRGRGGLGRGRDAQNHNRVDDSPINQIADAAEVVDPPDVPEDVLEDMRNQEQGGGYQLMDDDEIDADIQHVLQSRIADKTRKNYNDYSIRLLMFLFDHAVKFEGLIPPSILEALQVAQEKDINTLTRSGRPSKKRLNVRQVAREAFESIQEADASTHPIVLEKMTFRTLGHFFSTFNKRYTRTTVEGQTRVVPFQQGDNLEDVVYVRLHKSSYDGVTSALANLHTECRVPRDVNPEVKKMWETLSIYKKGTTRDGAKQRKKLGLRHSEGKDKMPFAAFVHLAEILHRSDNPEHIGAHLFLCLDWNMISRADSVITSNIELVGMSSDALTFDIGPTKTDQAGTAHVDHPFHIYSCPENPAICTVLSFCKHLICRPQILQGQCKLFEGSNQYERYCGILRRIVQSPEHRQSFIDRGLNPNYFGTHSMRKGAVTHIASGVTSSPPIASICIRANWKMPGVMSRYIKHESAGDQYVGRCVSGRNRLNKRFAESIPYFDLSEFDSIEKENMMRQLDAWIKDRMSEASAANESVFCMFKSCLASFYHHREWLDSTLHARSPIRTTIFWLEECPFAQYVVTRFPWTATDDTPNFTGIPVDVLYLAKIEQMQKRIDELEEKILNDNNRVIETITKHIDKSLDDRAVGGEGYGLTRTIVEKLDLLIDQQTKAMADRESNEIQHAGDDDDMSFGGDGGLEEEEMELDVEEKQVLQEQAIDAALKQKSKQLMEKRKHNGIFVGLVNGKLVNLPPGWRYPTMTIQQFVSMWLAGATENGVPPLRHLSPHDVRHFDRKGKTLNKMKSCMKVIEFVARRRGVWEPEKDKEKKKLWNKKTAKKCWEGVVADLMPYIETITKMDGKPDSTHKSRPLTHSWRTVADKLISVKGTILQME